MGVSCLRVLHHDILGWLVRLGCAKTIHEVLSIVRHVLLLGSQSRRTLEVGLTSWLRRSNLFMHQVSAHIICKLPWMASRVFVEGKM